MLRQCARALPVAILLVVLSSPLNGAPPRRTDWAREGVHRLQVAVARNGVEGYSMSRPATLGVLSDEGFLDVRVTLAGPREYVLAAACDEACADLDLEVLDGSGRVMASNTLDNPTPAISLTVDSSGTYALRLRMVDCKITMCRVVAGVFSPVGEAVASSR